ncbi:MAG: hypothetical protein IPM53_31300 [Anaerolineaceae bacterium]|nr:hypothetical protein [Anaerolineaceae bacterium]
MARVQLNPVLEQIHGQIGDLVFRRYEDQVVLARKSSPGQKEATPAQIATRERFRAGAQYGKLVMADPALKALYATAAKAKKKPVFSVMVADYLHAPSVTAVALDGYTGAADETITVNAYDDFEVMAVTVTLANEGGAVLESGAAVVENGRWTYTTTTAVTPGTTVTVTATAVDRPGNSGSAEVTMLVS